MAEDFQKKLRDFAEQVSVGRFSFLCADRPLQSAKTKNEIDDQDVRFFQFAPCDSPGWAEAVRMELEIFAEREFPEKCVPWGRPSDGDTVYLAHWDWTAEMHGRPGL